MQGRAVCNSIGEGSAEVRRAELYLEEGREIAAPVVKAHGKSDGSFAPRAVQAEAGRRGVRVAAHSKAEDDAVGEADVVLPLIGGVGQMGG